MIEWSVLVSISFKQRIRLLCSFHVYKKNIPKESSLFGKFGSVENCYNLGRTMAHLYSFM